jgi:hypothetical protein
MPSAKQIAKNVAWFGGHVLFNPKRWWSIGLFRWSWRMLLARFSWIVEHEAARCSQWYTSWQRHALVGREIRSIINLRGHNPKDLWWKRETRFAAMHNIEHHDTALSSRDLPPAERLIDLVNALENAARPFLLKCAGGQDRTGFAAALYLIICDGWQARDAALHQFDRWPGPKAEQNQEWLQHFFRYAEMEARGEPIAVWIRERYQHLAFIEWLDRNDLRNTYRGVQR